MVVVRFQFLHLEASNYLTLATENTHSLIPITFYSYLDQKFSRYQYRHTNYV